MPALPHNKSENTVTTISLKAFVFCLLVSGVYSGWTGMVTIGGFAGLLFSFPLACLLSYFLTLCLAEITTSYPVGNGMVMMVRLSISHYGGFMIGIFLALAYLCLAHAYTLYLVDLLKYIIPLKENGDPYIGDVQLYILATLFCIAVATLWGNWPFYLFFPCAALLFIGLVAYGFLAATDVSLDRLYMATSSFSNNGLMPYGLHSILLSLPLAVIFFAGIESIGMTMEDGGHHNRSMVETLRSSVLIITVVMVAVITVVFCLQYGSTLVAEKDHPYFFGMRSMSVSPATTYYFFSLLAMGVASLCFTICFGKTIFYLSRSGYLPLFLSGTPLKDSSKADTAVRNTIRRYPFPIYLYGSMFGFFFSGIYVGIDPASSARIITMAALFSLLLAYSLFFFAHLRLPDEHYQNDEEKEHFWQAFIDNGVYYCYRLAAGGG